MWFGCAMVNSQYPIRQAPWLPASSAPSHAWKSVATDGAGVWIAVSTDGFCMRSTDDGYTWAAVTIPEANTWNSVTYGNSVFVAVAGTGTNRVMRSTNGGATWTAVAAAEANAWTGVAYGNGVFVACSSDGTNRSMRSTDDGASWSAVATNDNNPWVDIAYGGGTFIMVAPSGTNRGNRSNDDGASWTNSFFGSNDPSAITYGGGNFVAPITNVNDVFRSSTGGVSWSGSSGFPFSTGSCVAYGNGVYVVLGSSGGTRCARSTDANSWTSITNMPQTATWTDIGFGNGVFVAISSEGYVIRSTNDVQNYGDIFQYSVDAILNLGFDTTMSYANSGFDQDYHGQIWGSTPTTFKELLQTTPYQYLFSQSNPRYIIQLWTFANGPASDPPVLDLTVAELTNEYNEVYEAVVYLLQTYSNKEFIIKNWEGDWQILNGFNPAVHVKSYTAERFIAFWGTRQRAIRDARAATPSTSTVKYCLEINRCLDNYGTRLHRDVLPHLKPDMVGWSAYEAINFWGQGWIRSAPNISFAGEDVKAVATNGSGVFVAVGTGGKVSFSYDGSATKWYPVDGGFSTSDVNSVIWVSGQSLFVAVGAAGKIATSPDGKTWTQRTSGTANQLNGIVSNGSTMFAYGNSTTLLRSTDGTTWSAATYSGGPPSGTPDYISGDYDEVIGYVVIGGTSGKMVYGGGGFFISVDPQFSGENVTVVRASRNGSGVFVAGGPNGKISKSTGFGGASWTAQTSQFSADAILDVAFSGSLWIATGTNGKLSSSADAETWTARTAGTGAYLNKCTYSTTEEVFAYGCDGATGYSQDGITWIVNGQAAMGGLNVNCMLSANDVTITGADNGTLTVARHWHIRTTARVNIDFYMRDGVSRIRRIMGDQIPIAITEFGFPQEQSEFSGIGLDVGEMIQQVVDTADDLGITGIVWWQIFDNEEQSPGVPRGFHLYYRDNDEAVPGALSPAGVKFQSIL